MAALQQTSISSQSKTLAAQALRSLFIHKPSNLSFSSTFPSLNISTAQHRSLNRGSGVRMTASTAISYASALAEVAQSNGTLDATCADVEKIEKFFTDPQVFDFFINPTVELEKKRQFLDEIAATAVLHPHTVNFINILVDAQRIDLIEEIVKEFEIVYNSLTNTELVVVSSVVELEVDQLSQISKQVQKLTGAKNVRMKSVIDPSLVAGFTIRYGSSGSRLIDMSVKKQLEDIAAQLDLGDIKLVA